MAVDVAGMETEQLEELQSSVPAELKRRYAIETIPDQVRSLASEYRSLTGEELPADVLQPEADAPSTDLVPIEPADSTE